MTDAYYLAGLLVFFALMAGYIRACESLGRPADDGRGTP